MSKEMKMDCTVLQNEAKKIAQVAENLQKLRKDAYRANCAAMEQWQGRCADSFADAAYASEEVISAQSVITQTLSETMSHAAIIRAALDVSIAKRAHGEKQQKD